MQCMKEKQVGKACPHRPHYKRQTHDLMDTLMTTATDQDVLMVGLENFDGVQDDEWDSSFED